MKNIPQTLDSALSYWAGKLPEKTFIHSLQKDYLFKQTKTITDNLAGFFISHSIVSGDSFCLLIPRIPELIFSFFAICKIRCIPTPINYLEGIEKIKKNILSVNPSVIIVDDTLVSEELKCYLVWAMLNMPKWRFKSM